MLDFRVVIAACVAGIVILFGGIGLVASLKIAQEPVRPANRIVERPRIESNGSLPLVIETPAVKHAPAREAVRTPEPAPAPAPVAAPAPVLPVEARAPAQAQPAPMETTGTITPRSAPVGPAPVGPAPVGPAPVIPPPAISAALAPAPGVTEPVENPAAVTGLPVNTKSAKKGPRRPRPAAPAENFNPFGALFGGVNQ